MNELKIFEHPQFGKVRTFNIGGDPWLVGTDFAVALGYQNPQRAIREHVDEDDKGVTEMVTPGGKQKTIIINESGLYSLVMSSHLPDAKKFKHWVTHDVLPSIRKTGSYDSPKQNLMTRDYLKAASILSGCPEKRLPYVLEVLQQAGFSLELMEEIPTPSGGFHNHFAKTPQDTEDQLAACEAIRIVVQDLGFSYARLNEITNITRSLLWRYAHQTNLPFPKRARFLLDTLEPIIQRKDESLSCPYSG